jgi:hypothetical protein
MKRMLISVDRRTEESKDYYKNVELANQKEGVEELT